MTNNEVNVRLRDAIAACLLVIMTARAAVRRKTEISLWDKIMLSLTMLIFRLILSIPDCLFFWWRDKPSLTIIDMDEKQQPVKIYQVQEKDLILFCMTEFNMDFRINEWKELETKLKERILTAKHNRLQLEQWLRQGRACLIPGATKITTLEFDSPDGFVSKLLPVEAVPDAITAAIIVIHNNYPNSIIFHSEQELDGWLEKLPWKQRKSIHAQIDEFRYKREWLLVNGQRE